jgi:hypothetical protein
MTSQNDFEEYLINNLLIKYGYTNFCVPVKSSTTNKEYSVQVLYIKDLDNIKYQCNCGVQFNGKLRNKCKHIKHVMLTAYEALRNIEREELNAEDLANNFTEMEI